MKLAIAMKFVVIGILISCSLLTYSQNLRKPNIIYIMADDLGYRELGCYGQEKIHTPHIDRLAAEGIKFTDFYSGGALCAPSRSVLLTGKHLGNTWIRNNREDASGRSGQEPLRENTLTIGTVLKNAGYVTGAIGKWGLGGYGSTGMPHLQGFDYFYGYLNQLHAHNYYPDSLYEENILDGIDDHPWDDLGNRNIRVHEPLGSMDSPLDPAAYFRFVGSKWAQEAMADKSLDFIEQYKDTQFFLYLPFPVPHAALQAPLDSVEKYYGKDFPEAPYLGTDSYTPVYKPRATYATMITLMDLYIGRIMDKLKETGLDSNTVVFFFSDNGTTFNGGVDRAFFNSLGELRGVKRTFFEGGIRVPHIVRWPGKITPGRTDSLLSYQPDILPTIAEMCWGHIPDDIDGISLMPTLLDTGKQKLHEYLYWENAAEPYANQIVRMGYWKLFRSDIRKVDDRYELYNLADDISEERNIIIDHPDVVKKMKYYMFNRSPSHIGFWNFRFPELDTVDYNILFLPTLVAYPNPTQGLITIEFGRPYGLVKCIVRTIHGQLIHSSQHYSGSKFDLSIEGPKGLYFIEVFAGSQKRTLKVMKLL